MLDPILFAEKVNHNTAMLHSAIQSGRTIVSILSELHTLSNRPGELHSSVLMRNAHDIIPAAYLGLLASVNTNGVDAYHIGADGTVTEYELKTAEVRGHQIWKGPRGGLRVGEFGRTSKSCGVTSYLNAKYDITNNLHSKNLKTALLVCDTDGPDGYFDAWELDGSIVMRRLNERTGSLSIKLGTFMRYGRQANTVVPVRGYDDWAREIRRNADTAWDIYY